MTGTLYVVGTYHFDIDGRQRLDTLLDKLSPAIVALEFSKDREVGASRKASSEDIAKSTDEMFTKAGVAITPLQKSTLVEVGTKVAGCMGFERASTNAYLERNRSAVLEYIDISVFTNGEKEFRQGYGQICQVLSDTVVGNPKVCDEILQFLNGGVEGNLNSLRATSDQFYQNAELFAEVANAMKDPVVFRQNTQTLPSHVVDVLRGIYNPQRDETMASRIRELCTENKTVVAVVGLMHMMTLEEKLADLKPVVLPLAEYDSI